MANLRLVTAVGGEPRVFPVDQISAVFLLAKLLITSSIITNSVNNVNRYVSRGRIRLAVLYSLDRDA